MSWSRLLVTGLSLQGPGLNSRPVHVGFVVDKGTLGQVFLWGQYFDLIIAVLFHQLSIFMHSLIADAVQSK
jgi:hypothetical protein